MYAFFEANQAGDFDEFLHERRCSQRKRLRMYPVGDLIRNAESATFSLEVTVTYFLKTV